MIFLKRTNMKYFALILLMASFVGIAVFGFAIFDHGISHSNSGCIISAIDGTVCPMSIADLAMYHISTLQTLLRTLIPSGLDFILLLLFLFFVSILTFSFYKDLLHSKQKFLFQRLRDFEFVFSYNKRKFISWLALFEYSPSF